MRLLILLLMVPASALAQTARPSQAHAEGRFGVGGVAGPGTAGLLGAMRISVPASPRVAFDVDAGLLSASSDRARGMVGAQLRWLRTPRRASGASDYGIFGLMHAREQRRTEIRFPDETIVQTENVTGLTPVVGYGIDGVLSNGARVGLELTGGGSENAGPRLFLKVFATWGPPR
jgi:hypothetical protein